MNTVKIRYQYSGKETKQSTAKVFDDSTSQTLALGGITEGVYNYEMCAAYASIANGGVYNKPTLYSKVVDHDMATFFLTEQANLIQLSKTAQLIFLPVQWKMLSIPEQVQHASFRNMPVAGRQVPQHPIKTYGSVDLHHIIHVLYGADL